MRYFTGTVLWFAIIFSFIGCATTNSPQEKGRYVEKSGGFSILIPESWQKTDIAGLKYKALVGPTANGFGENIVFVDEAFGGDMDFYIEAVIEQLGKIPGKDITILQRSDFATLKNLQGVKLIIDTVQEDAHARQIMYCFPGFGKKILLTCTVLAKAGEIYDAMFDSIIETFEWTK